jgi:hypothetical protein
MCVHREAGHDRGPGARRALDVQASAQRRQALAHAGETHARAHGGGIEAAAVVARVQDDHVVHVGERERHLARLRVAADVGQRLLGDAHERQLGVRVQRDRLSRDVELRVHPAGAGGHLGEGVRQLGVVELDWP